MHDDLVQALLESRCAEVEPPVCVHDERAAIEHEFVLPADHVDVHDRPLDLLDTPPHDGFAFGLARDLVRRTVDRDDAFRTGQPGRLDGCRLPDVFADGEAETDAVQLEHRRVPAFRKIAFFVEHAVVRQQLLAVGGQPAAVVVEGTSVVDDAVRVLGETNEDRDVADRRLDAIDGSLDVAPQARMEQEILRRIAADTQFRKYDKVGAQFFACAHGVLDDLRRVARNVADDEIDLGERQDHGVAHAVALIRPRRTWVRRRARPPSCGRVPLANAR